MAIPCIIVFKGKEYPYEQFATMLHDGLLDQLIKEKTIDVSKFIKPKENATKEIVVQEGVSEQRPGGNKSGKAAETGGSNRVLDTEKSEEKIIDAPQSRSLKDFEGAVTLKEVGNSHDVIFTDKEGKETKIGKVHGIGEKTGVERDSWVAPQLEAIHYKEVIKAVERGENVPKSVVEHYLSSKIESDHDGKLAEAIKNVEDNGPTKDIFSEMEIEDAFRKREETLSQMARGKDYKTQFIHDNFGGISLADWKRFGDANWLKGKEGRAFKRKYIKEGEVNLEQVADALSVDAKVEITPQDIIDYIIDREANPKKYDGRLKKWDDAARIPEKDVSSILEGDDAMIVKVVEANRGFGMTDMEVDLIKKYVEDVAKKKRSEQRAAASVPENSRPTSKSSEVGRKKAESKKEKPVSEPVKKSASPKKTKAEENKYAKAEEKITKVFDLLRKKMIADLPEGTQKMGFGLEDLLNTAEQVIIKAIRAGEKIDIAIGKGIDHIKERWDKSFGEFPEKEIRDILLEGKMGEIKLVHKKTDVLREELGMEPRQERKSVSVDQTISEARKRIEKGVDVNRIADDVISNKRSATPVEHVILTEKIAILKKEIDSMDISDPAFNKKYAEIKNLIRASEQSGSEAGAALGIRSRVERSADESLIDYFMKEEELNGGVALTENQKKQVKTEFDAVSKAKEALEKKVSQLEKENEKLKSEKEFEVLVKKKTKKIAKEKLDEDFENLSKEFRKTMTINAGINPEAVPIVMRMVKNRIEKGIITLSEVVDAVHEKLSEHGITKEDILDVIAGKNAEKRTRSEASVQMYDLRKEARLIRQLEDLQNGKEPSTDRKVIQKNKRIEDIRKQIKEHDLTKLAVYKKNVERSIEKLQQELDAGIFPEKEAKTPLKLDKEAIALKDEYIKKKMERDVRILRREYENRTNYEKGRDITLDILNVPRTIMSSMDYSAPLRQGLFASVANPDLAVKAGLEMFRQSVSQKRFDRWFHDVKSDPRYARSQEAGLFIADPHDLRLSVKEEAFMNNLAEKIPVVGKFIKGSERAYVGYLNKMRWDVYNRLAEVYKGQGRTFENSPELYKSLADYVNNSTGRGKLGPLESAAPILNTALFAPRLIASRVNMLTNWFNPKWYMKTPKEVRVQYMKDMIKFLGAGMIVLGLAKLNGAEVEEDPRSSDFGKIKSGKTRWDVWGGHQQYIRLFAQLLTGQSKSTKTGNIQELNGQGIFGTSRADVAGNFVRGKLAPIPSVAWDFLKGRTVRGEKATVLGETESHMLPLIYSDLSEALKDQGVKAIFNVGVPSVFGVGVQTYGDIKKDIKDIQEDQKYSKSRRKRVKKSSFH